MLLWFGYMAMINHLHLIKQKYQLYKKKKKKCIQSHNEHWKLLYDEKEKCLKWYIYILYNTAIEENIKSIKIMWLIIK